MFYILLAADTCVVVVVTTGVSRVTQIAGSRARANELLTVEA